MKNLILMTVMLVVSGCASVVVEDGNGFRIKRMSYPFSSSKMNGFSMTVSSNGVRTIKVEGYGYESQDSMHNTVGALATGFAAGLKASNPTP